MANYSSNGTYSNSTLNNVNSKSSSNVTTKSSERVNGINSWVVLLLGVFILHLIIENYLSYGIIKNPINLTIDFWEFMKVHWWCFVLPILSTILQTVLCFLIEKLLSKEFLSEKVGMTAHLFNSLITFGVISIICSVQKLNPVAGVVIATHIFLISIKFWSFAFVNKKNRDIYKKQKKEDIIYPKNVTFGNVLRFIFQTPASVYNIRDFKKKPPNYLKVASGIAQAILIYYFCGFLFYQYIIPEGKHIIECINTEEYFRMVGHILKLAFPVNILWLTFFYNYFFKLYLPLTSFISGFDQDICLATDWWNSENTTIFWTKWNYQVHMWMKECFFIPMLEMGYSKKMAALAVGVVSGILHEFVFSIPCRSSYGLPMLAMLIQIPLAQISRLIHRHIGGKMGNIFVWSSLIIGHPLCAALMFYNYVRLDSP